MHNTILSSESLRGNKVLNNADDDLGGIKDFMVDTDDGTIIYAVLDFGGFLGIGNKLFAVPMSALKLDCENKCFRLDHTKETLKNAQGFDQDNWPNMADTQWRESLDSFYKSDTK